MSPASTPVDIAELCDVSVRVGDATLLADACLRLPAATTTAVVGASGSGKSTLLKLFNGLNEPSAGRVLRDGTPIDYNDLRRLRFDTGYALQETGLYPHLSAAENIRLPMRLAGLEPGDQQRRLEELAALMQLTHAQLSRYPAALSGGQQQRVGICRAMALRPSLLLLDEAFSGLDAITRATLHQQFLDLPDTAFNACLLVTHDLHEARRLADRLVILQSGRIVRQGATAEVFADPQHDYAAALLRDFSA